MSSPLQFFFRMVITVLLIISLPCGEATPANEPEMSLICKYYMVAIERELIRRCGDQLDPDTEKRYSSFRSIAEEHFRRENVDLKQQFSTDIDDRVERDIRSSPVFMNICQTRDRYEELVKKFHKQISQDELDKVLSDMATAKNPLKGDCL